MGLSIRNLSKRLGEFRLSVDLEVKDGELLSILGPSGCGKTTTLRLVAGIEEPDSGSITVDGRDLTFLPAQEREVGMVFQNHALFPHMNVYRNIAYGPKTKKWDPAEIDERVARLLELVGLTGFEKRRPHQLSGGEQQRVALARALAANPRLILFDEPLSSLDVQLKTRLRKEIRRIQQALGITALYVTHDQEEALAVSDRIAILNEGRIEQIGTPEELYQHPSTVFTASFIGKSNLLQGKVLGGADGLYTVDTILGAVQARCGNGEREFNTGEEVLLFFRPEAVSAAIRSEKTTDSKTGRITGLEYQGNTYLAEIRIDETVILAEVSPKLGRRTGEEVSLSIDTGACTKLIFSI